MIRTCLYQSSITQVFGALLFVVAMIGCSGRMAPRVVGTWEWKGCDDAGEITYQKDHTFISREWAVSHTQQPPIIFDSGDWNIRNSELTLDFKGESRPADARHLVTKIVVCAEDVLVLRNSDGVARIFERAKVKPH